MVALDTILSSLGFAAGFLFLANWPMFFIENGRFLEGSILLGEIIAVILFLTIGSILRRKYQLKARFGTYVGFGFLIAVVAYYPINYLPYYIEMLSV